MRKIKELYIKFKAFLKRIFSKYSIKDVRRFVKLRKGIFKSERIFEDLNEMRRFAEFFEKNEELLTLILNDLDLKYKNTADAFYNVFIQASFDYRAITKDHELEKKKK